MISDKFKQSHFIVYELQLPYCTVCTPADGLTSSWHTPVTCVESSDDTYSLWFTRNLGLQMQPPSTSINIKSKLNSSVWKVVTGASETTPTIKPGEGMASRGTMSLTLSDFEGDPGPINFSENGTFFGKLKARNVLDGKKIVSHYYSIVNGNPTPQLVGSSTHFIESATLSGGKFTIKGKDALKDLEAFSQQFPIPTESTLTADIDASTLVIPVTDGTLYAANDVIIIDEELMLIDSVTANDITVFTRGSTYAAPDLRVIYKTEAEEHSIDSTVQICYVMDKKFLSSVLKDVFDGVGLSTYVNFAQWDAEITEWNANAFLYGVFHEPKSADKLINQLLSNYMVDMWLDQTTQLALVSATTTWKQAIRTITEGEDFSDLSTSTKADTRFSRAYIYNNKEYQSKNDDSTNYSQLTIFKDTATETDDFYGSIKVKEFDPSSFITPASAEILTSRFVQRYAKTPESLSFKMEERKLAGSGLGDIVDIVTRDSQTPSGEYLEARVRAQLISIKPNLGDIGRTYNVKALSYVPLIDSNGGDLTIFISGTVFDLNLFSRAGAPPDAINVTYVFDAATVGSSDQSVPAIRAGLFAAGSSIKLIFTNNSKVSAIGGNGGSSRVYRNTGENFVIETTKAGDGGLVYQSDGVNSNLYLNYGIVDTYMTSCDFYSPGGGGESVAALTFDSGSPSYLANASGGGGNGLPNGVAGGASDFFSDDFYYDRSFVSRGFDGTFDSGGNGVIAALNLNLSVTSGSGGNGDDGSIAFASPSWDDASLGGIGLSGASIKGSGVTVYNLASESSKFTTGNSDPFTLVDA